MGAGLTARPECSDPDTSVILRYRNESARQWQRLYRLLAAEHVVPRCRSAIPFHTFPGKALKSAKSMVRPQLMTSTNSDALKIIWVRFRFACLLPF